MLNRPVLFIAIISATASAPAWAQYPNYPPAPQYPAQPSYPAAPSSSYPYQAPASSYPYQAQPPAYPYPTQPPQQQPEAPRLAPQDLSNLVAPIALYPDLLLSEVLAASTYPLELVQAEQWMQANPGLRGPALVDAAKQQNWDPSVQALVAFPDVLSRLTSDIQWTTALGNAFLAQQADVMDAIQQLRAEARANGRLTDTPQQRVVMDQQNGQSAIEIQPADPQMVYAPVYNPAYVWGPPVYGAYPVLAYPPVGYGIYYGIGAFLGAFFSGFLAFGGWGWGLSWLTHGLFLNSLFFGHFGFHGFGGPGYFAGRGYAAHVAWTHDPAHRLGVPYPNRAVAARFGGGFGAREGFGGRSGFAGNYRNSYGGRSFESGRAGNYGSGFANANRQAEAYRGLTARESQGSSYNGSSGYRSAYRSGGYARENSFRNSGAQDYSRQAARGGSEQTARSFRSSEPRGSSEHFSSHSSSSHFSAPKSSRGFGGGGGGHSGGGHGHSGGGGHSHGHKK